MARIALVHDVAGVAAVQAKLLRSAGHEVDQIALPELGAGWLWPAKALAIPFRLAAYLPIVNRLRAKRYDVIHIHWLTHGIAGVLARRPFLVQAHGSELHRNLGKPVYGGVTRSVLRNARTVFYVTPNLRAFMEDYREKLVFLPNPVDMRGVGEKAPTQVSKVVIFTRLDPVKGVDRIFPAVGRLHGAVDLTALEWGPLSGEYVRKYGSLVRFVPTIPHGEVGSFLEHFDLVIGQMRQGILSLMEIEALGAGRPVITGIDWGLYPDDPPPVIAASGPDEIVEAVERLRNDSAELARLSREGLAWVERNHGYARHLELLEAAYFGSPKQS